MENDSRGCLLYDIAGRLQVILDLIAHPEAATLFSLHPNNLGHTSFNSPQEWDSWWKWAPSPGAENYNEDLPSEVDAPWLMLLRYYDSRCRSTDDGASPAAFQSIPLSLRSLVDKAHEISLPRNRGRVQQSSTSSHLDGVLTSSVNSLTSSALPGMSPKKAHEVAEMARYIQALLSHTKDVKHVVDVGAGQVRPFSQLTRGLLISDRHLGISLSDAAGRPRPPRPRSGLERCPV